ncbi:MAG: PqqD family protein [Thermoplasmata archaeon]
MAPILRELSVPSRNRDVVERFGEHEMLLFHSALGKLFEVNEVGQEIWKLCDGTRTVRQISGELTARFATPDAVDRDVRRFLKELVRLNLVHVT